MSPGAQCHCMTLCVTVPLCVTLRHCHCVPLCDTVTVWHCHCLILCVTMSKCEIVCHYVALCHYLILCDTVCHCVIVKHYVTLCYYVTLSLFVTLWHHVSLCVTSLSRQNHSLAFKGNVVIRRSSLQSSLVVSLSRMKSSTRNCLSLNWFVPV